MIIHQTQIWYTVYFKFKRNQRCLVWHEPRCFPSFHVMQQVKLTQMCALHWNFLVDNLHKIKSQNKNAATTKQIEFIILFIVAFKLCLGALQLSTRAPDKEWYHKICQLMHTFQLCNQEIRYHFLSLTCVLDAHGCIQSVFVVQVHVYKSYVQPQIKETWNRKINIFQTSSFYTQNIAVPARFGTKLNNNLTIYTVCLLSFRTNCAEQILCVPSCGHPQKHKGASLNTLCA
jgi:hypothetical protein